MQTNPLKINMKGSSLGATFSRLFQNVKRTEPGRLCAGRPEE